MNLDQIPGAIQKRSSEIERLMADLAASILEAQYKYLYFLLAASGACLGYGLPKLEGQPRSLITALAIISCLSWIASIYFGCGALQKSQEISTHIFHGYAIEKNELFSAEPYGSKKQREHLESKIFEDKKSYDKNRMKQFLLLIAGVLLFPIWRMILWWYSSANVTH